MFFSKPLITSHFNIFTLTYKKTADDLFCQPPPTPCSCSNSWGVVTTLILSAASNALGDSAELGEVVTTIIFSATSNL